MFPRGRMQLLKCVYLILSNKSNNLFSVHILLSATVALKQGVSIALFKELLFHSIHSSYFTLLGCL